MNAVGGQESYKVVSITRLNNVRPACTYNPADVSGQAIQWSLTRWTGGGEELGGVGEAVEPGRTRGARSHALPVRVAPSLAGKGAGGAVGAVVTQGADPTHSGEVRLSGARTARVRQGDVVRSRIGAIDARRAVITCKEEAVSNSVQCFLSIY